MKQRAPLLPPRCAHSHVLRLRHPALKSVPVQSLARFSTLLLAWVSALVLHLQLLLYCCRSHSALPATRALLQGCGRRQLLQHDARVARGPHWDPKAADGVGEAADEGVR